MGWDRTVVPVDPHGLRCVVVLASVDLGMESGSVIGHVGKGRPVGVTWMGWSLAFLASTTLLLSALWVSFSGPISEAGRELAEGAGQLGLIAAPLQFALPFGVSAGVASVFTIVVARGLLRGLVWALVTTRVVLAVMACATVGWGYVVFRWLLEQSVADPKAPPPFASALIVGFPVTVAVGILLLGVWYLTRPDVGRWFGGER